MSASKNLGKVFMTPKGIWDKNSNYTKLDIVTNKVGKISCGYIATTDIEKNIEITDNRWLKLFELLDGDLTEEYKAVQTDVTNKATAVNTNKKAVDLIYSQMQKLYDVEISTTTPTNERTGLWINPDDISGVINIPEIKDDEVSDVDTWSSKKIDNVTNSLKEDISTKITKFYASSQGETHLADSDNGKIMDMMLYGKSEQKQYNGKNLLNATLQTTTQNGVTCTNNGDGTYTLDGTANANAVFNLGSVTFTGDTKYKICGCPQGGGIIERYHIEPYGSTNEQRDIGNGVIYSLSNDETKAIYIVVTIGFRASNLLFKPMITTNLTATYDDFEPYTGGIPSPNPDYPQEIKSVVNPAIKICGKNLLKATLQTTTVNGVTCTNNGDGTYTLNGTATTITTFDIAQDVSCSSFRLVGCPVGGAHDASYELQARTNNLIYGYDTGDGKNIKADENFFIRIRINAGINCNNLLFKPMIVDASLYPDATYDDFEPYHKQAVTLPYTLNAIPVSSGGNATIDGQQYVSDYVDVERGKLVKMVDSSKLDNTQSIVGKTEWLLAEPQETDLTKEEIAAFKALATYYPTTNISVNSEQLDGYTVFNYPISMANIITSLKTKTENLESANYTDRGTLADTDAFLINDGTGMKKSVLSKLSDFVLNKIADKVFAKLQTNNKTILGAINELNSKSLFASKWIYLNITTGILSSLEQLKFPGIYKFNKINEALLTDSDGNKMNDLLGDYYSVLIAQDFTNNGGVAYGILLLFSPRIQDGFWYCNIWASKIRRWRKILLS